MSWILRYGALFFHGSLATLTCRRQTAARECTCRVCQMR